MPVLNVNRSNLNQSVEVPIPGRASPLSGTVVEGEPTPIGPEGTVPMSDGTTWVPTAFIDPSDPPALTLTIFGEARMVGFSQSQLLASSNDPPRYNWTLPVEVSQYAVGPDGATYTGSGSGGGVMRTALRGSGTLLRYPLAASGAPRNLGFFAGQCPASGLDPWTFFLVEAGAVVRRFPAAAMQGATQPSWVTGDAFTGIAAPDDAAFDAVGNVWFQQTTALRRFTNLAGAAGAATADVEIVGANWPSGLDGIAVSPGGDLWVGRYSGGGDLRMLDAAGIAAIVGLGVQDPVPTVIITSTELAGAEFPVFDYAGNLWVASYDNTRVLRFPAASLTTSGAKTPDIVLRGGGLLGNGSATGPVVMRFQPGFGPVR